VVYSLDELCLADGSMVENMQLGGENKQNITAWEFIPGTLEPHFFLISSMNTYQNDLPTNSKLCDSAVP